MVREISKWLRWVCMREMSYSGILKGRSNRRKGSSRRVAFPGLKIDSRYGNGLIKRDTR